MRWAAWSSSGWPEDSNTCTSYKVPSRLIDTSRRKLPSVPLAPRFFWVVEVADALDLLTPLVFIPGAFVAHGRGGIQAGGCVGDLAYNCCSLASSASRLEISSDRVELSKVGAGLTGSGCGSVLVFSRWTGAFCGLRCDGGHRRLGRSLLDLGLRRRRWRDFIDLVVLERRQFGGLGDGFLVEGAAALLIVLG